MGRIKEKPLASIGQFTPVPHRVMKSDNYMSLSHTAARLLWDIAAQWGKDNNGRLLASWAKMSARGWKSADTLHRARTELVKAGFIYQTVQGHRPNKASWYAITWFPLEKLNGYDAGVEKNYRRWAFENTSLKPVIGQAVVATDPAIGQASTPVSPTISLMTARKTQPSSPIVGHPLEIPCIEVIERYA